MFRNQYDSDVTVWSPQGRLHQVEYAVEAVKLGSACVGLKNSTHALLVALKRATSELSAHQKKIIPIDRHIGISISGLTADARVLSRFMRNECMSHSFSYDEPMPISRLMTLVGNKMQVSTQRYDRRPFGVGVLVAGYDEDGPHIYQLCPSANVFECKAMAIGARSQSARTFLEKNLDNLPNCTTEELVRQGLRALRDTLPNETELNIKNVAIALVGKNMELKEFNEQEIEEYLKMIQGEERRGISSTISSSGTGTGGSSGTGGGTYDGGEPTEQEAPPPQPDVAMDES